MFGFQLRQIGVVSKTSITRRYALWRVSTFLPCAAIGSPIPLCYDAYVCIPSARMLAKSASVGLARSRGCLYIASRVDCCLRFSIALGPVGPAKRTRPQSRSTFGISISLKKRQLGQDWRKILRNGIACWTIFCLLITAIRLVTGCTSTLCKHRVVLAFHVAFTRFCVHRILPGPDRLFSFYSHRLSLAVRTNLGSSLPALFSDGPPPEQVAAKPQPGSQERSFTEPRSFIESRSGCGRAFPGFPCQLKSCPHRGPAATAAR